MPRYKAPEGPIDYDIELDLTNEHLDKLESTELRPTLQVRQSLRKGSNTGCGYLCVIVSSVRAACCQICGRKD